MQAKVRAWATHLALSFLVLLPVFLVIFLLWFPPPFFEVQATAGIIVVLIGVDLVLGPLLTFIVYKPGKKGLKFDLTVIVLLQLTALVYGTWSIHSERPTYVVFAVDRYEPLANKDVDFAAAGLEGFGEARWRGPIYAFAEMPFGEEFNRLQDGVIFRGEPDLERRPEYWRPLAVGRDAILASASPISELVDARPGVADALRQKAEALGLDPDAARFVPVMGKSKEFVGFLDPETAEIRGVLDVDPFGDR